MSFSVNWLAVVLAAVAAFAFGAVWYTALSKQWLAALGKTREQLNVGFTPFIWSIVVELIMAFVLAVFVGNLPGGITITTTLTVAIVAWVGFVVTTLTMNHRYEGMSWALTIIDSLHLLGVLVAMAIVIGLFGGGMVPVVA